MTSSMRLVGLKCLQWTIIMLFAVYLLVLFYYKSYVNDWQAVAKAYFSSREADSLLEDVLLSNQQPVSDKSIFFVETSWQNRQQARSFTLNSRQACSIESAALHNPNSQIFVLFVNPMQSDKRNDHYRVLSSYPNMHFRTLDIERFVRDTRAAKWYAEQKLSKSNFPVEHTADFLRFLILWRWGGTYLDMDVVVQRSLELLPPNYTGAQSNDKMAVGVFNFAATGFGHSVAEQCIDEFMNNFNGYQWDNGPRVLDAVLYWLCNGAHTVPEMSLERCQGFKVYEPKVFYPIYYKEWQQYFLASEYEHAMAQLGESYAAHVWNKFSKEFQFKSKTEKSAYATLATENCPQICQLHNCQF